MRRISLVLLCLEACDRSAGDIAGPNSAKVGETVVITSEGVLRSKPGDVTMLSLLGYDDGGVLAGLQITELTLKGGTELTDREGPASREPDVRSNQVYVRHDRRAVKYSAKAEVTCGAPGEVRSESRPDVLFGLQWEYDDGNSGGCLGRFQEPDGCAYAFSCTE